MSKPAPDLSPQLIFTEAAAIKVKQLIDEENEPSLKLRVFVVGGGCSGLQYSFTFDVNINADDFVINKRVVVAGVEVVVSLLVDSMSYQYLQGAEIDYREDINGSQFVIRNPNAKTTCGCGSSFSVD